MAYNDITEAGIYDTSYLKLRDVTLSYNVPKFWGIDLNVFAFARNILIWAKMPNLDPENSQGNGNIVPKFLGIDLNVFAFARNILIWAKMPNLDPENSQGNGNILHLAHQASVVV